MRYNTCVNNFDFDIEFKSLYEIRLKHAQDKDKIVYYDYLMYKRGSGWCTGLLNDDWRRPCKIKRAKYNAEFLKNLPNYYFLGFPIKELLKSPYSDGLCHACAVALSLYFDEFEIITCDLTNYTAYYNKHSEDRKREQYEHSFILVNIDNKKYVIDSTWGIITDYNTYKHIFGVKNVRTLSSNELKNNIIYQYIKERKNIKGPDIYNDEYSKEIHKYMAMCENYKNPDNKHLEDFISRCLFRTSNSTCMWNIMSSRETKVMIDYQIDYPDKNMLSIVDDEHDFLIESPYKDTIERNKRVLESYHSKKKKSLKEKVLTLFDDIIEY